ncbi:MAG: pyridoxamine 5'-phosphate oxidase family protein [Verrucomicrobia bacterium]|nr:pyridoxamine 5'-phosphate oxidase family protein [Verrucomicrobiota bacterium]
MTLDELHDLACEQLARAASDPEHPFRYPVFATVDAAGRPALRTVVLRAFTKEPGRLVFFTDRRSPKCGQILRQPASGWLFYDRSRRLQVRVDGLSIVIEDEQGRNHYLEDAKRSWRDYAGRMPPGAVIPYSRAADPGALPATNDLVNFAVIETRIETLELLLLRREGHLRARFHWRQPPRAEWLAP